MQAPQRLNVLISRARDALIMIGNMQTFLHARKGNRVWKQFFDFISPKGYVREGFPIKCEIHPDRTRVLCQPEDFELHCPDGGCSEPWHVFPSHKLSDSN